MKEAWRDLVRHRAVLWMLILRDIKVQYRHAALGFAWAVMKPGILMVVMTVVFSRFARFPSEGFPYSIWVLAALVPWTFFAAALTTGASSLVAHPNLVTKIRFPREILPLAAVGSATFDLLIGLGLFAVLMAVYGIPVTGSIIYAVPLLAILIIWTTAFSLVLAAANVFYRDVRVVAPLLVQVWLFLSPVLYPISVVPDRWKALYAANPMVGVVDGLRRTLLAGHAPDAWTFASAGVASSGFLVIAYLYFKRVEPEFADVV